MMTLTQKYDIDWYYVFSRGTLALLTTFSAAFLFGKRDMMIAFIIILGATVLERQNLQVRTFYKLVHFLALEVSIVCLAYLASLHIGFGLILNLIIIFLIIYTHVSPYEQVTYKHFVMLYVFCQYISTDVAKLPDRLLLVLYTVGIIGTYLLLHQKKNKSVLDANLIEAWKTIYNQIEYMLKESFDEDLVEQCGNHLSALAYSVYRSSHKHYLTTYLGKVQFNLYINTGYFNLFLTRVYYAYKRKEITESELKQLKEIIREMIIYGEEHRELEKLIDKMHQFINQYEKETDLSEELLHIISILAKNFEELQGLDHHSKNQIYNEWEKSDLDQFYTLFKSHLKSESIGFNFAIRMSITLSIALLIGQVLGFYKIIWAIIPIMSIMQPYYEETLIKTRERVKSNVIACVVVALIINGVNYEGITIMILCLSFYLIYIFRDYYRMSLFLAMLSMCVSALSSSINVLVIYRVVYVLIGAGIVVLGSKFLPYHIEDGIKELVEELDKLNDILEEESIAGIQGRENVTRIRDAIIHSALLSQKLYTKNLQYKDAKISKMIALNNEFVIKLGYKVLRSI